MLLCYLINNRGGLGEEREGRLTLKEHRVWKSGLCEWCVYLPQGCAAWWQWPSRSSCGLALAIQQYPVF